MKYDNAEDNQGYSSSSERAGAKAVLIVIVALMTFILFCSLASGGGYDRGGALSAAETQKSDAFHSYRMDYRSTHDIPKDRKVWQSVKIYSPDMKWYGYFELSGDREGIREGSKDIACWSGKVMVVEAATGKQKEVLKTEKTGTQYQAVRFGIEDWTKDSRYLLISRQDKTGYDTLFAFYDLSAGALHSMSAPESDVYTAGWKDGAFICHRGNFISAARTAKNGNFFSWTPPSEKLEQMKVSEQEAERLEKLRDRNGLVKNGDREELRDN